LVPNEVRHRSVAQPGSAPRSGRGGRRFKSCHSDQYLAQFGTATATDIATETRQATIMARKADRPKWSTSVRFNPHAVATIPQDWRPSGNYSADHGDTAERPFALPGRIKRAGRHLKQRSNSK